MRSILIGRIEEGDAAIKGVLNELDHFGLGLGRAMIGRHASTAQPDSRNF